MKREQEKQEAAVKDASHLNRERLTAGLQWHTPLIPALGRQRKVDLCEFKVSLIVL